MLDTRANGTQDTPNRTSDSQDGITGSMLEAKQSKKENIRLGYLLLHAFVIALGMFQFGKYTSLRTQKGHFLTCGYNQQAT